ncbi:DUF1571 domain-containing protein [Tundrisphaera sp. TA3]|uniref:DUF1571 domain-containing protein n=1 Tax=Tundrisphaera sp. TA3 TaxID=3435775 RepID=UPI003EB91720
MLMLGCWSAPAGTGEASGPPPAGAEAAPPRIAAASRENSGAKGADLAARPLGTDARAEPEAEAIDRAKRAIADCQERFQSVKDYTCKFYKRERIDGRLVKPHIMEMKSRTAPLSFYFKFEQPNAGREAIYVTGKNRGRVYAHDVGLGRMLAGTMNLDPRGSMAMEENRHPITEAGIGALIETVRQRWDIELHPGEARIAFHPSASVDQRPCLLIETIHPSRQDDFLFHKVKLYIDRELGLPIRFEAYDWPKKPGLEPELVEEYTYAKLRVNVGLLERDFDPNNPLYSYGRF